MTRHRSEIDFPAVGVDWTPPDPIRIWLETPRLLIRAYELADVPAVFEAIASNRDHLLPFMPWARDGHADETATEAYLSLQIDALAQPASFASVGVGIFERASGRFMGGTGVHDVRRDCASAETGYWIRSDACGQGLAGEATARIISWALTPQDDGGLGLNRMRIFCSSANGNSVRVAEKLGLPQEMHLRDDYYVEGVGLTDRLGWGVLAHEWDTNEHAIRST